MMTASEILEMFRKRPIPPGQINLYKVLYEADRSLTKEQIADLMREGDVKSLDGVFLALATRISSDLSDYNRDDVLREIFEIMPGIHGETFRMRPQMQRAINECADLRQVIEIKTVQQIYEDYGRFPSDKSKYLKVSCTD